jgi:hypothetical protein
MKVAPNHVVARLPAGPAPQLAFAAPPPTLSTPLATPSAGWTISSLQTLKTQLKSFGSQDRLPVVAQALWLRPQQLLGLALEPGLPTAARVLLTDVLVARAPELDAASWQPLAAAIRTSTGVVAENLVETLTALRPSLDERHAAALLKSLRAVKAVGGVAARLDVLRDYLATQTTPMATPTARLKSDAIQPLSAAERTSLQAVIAVDDEAIVNAKIPADFPLRTDFESNFYSKGHLGRGVAGKLVCDTGNALEPGMFDHHQLGERTCAAALVLNRAELLVAHHLSSPITELICHSSPDLDAVSSVFFAELLLRDGKLPDGASRLAHYVTLEDNARIPVGNGDPTKHLATLCREAALQLAKQRHPAPRGDVPTDVQHRRDQEVLTVVQGILTYVLASGLAPTDEALFTHLASKPESVLPMTVRQDITELQGLVAAAEQSAIAQLDQVKFTTGRVPRLDGKGTLQAKFAITESGGKRLDAMLREKFGADIVIIATPDYTWTAAAPTSGASVRILAAGYETMERQLAREQHHDRQPATGDRLQPGWSVTNPYYIGGTDSFVVTPRGALLSTAERLDIISAVANWGSA